jgi:hypothetical protein
MEIKTFVLAEFAFCVFADVTLAFVARLGGRYQPPPTGVPAPKQRLATVELSAESSRRGFVDRSAEACDGVVGVCAHSRHVFHPLQCVGRDVLGVDGYQHGARRFARNTSGAPPHVDGSR